MGRALVPGAFNYIVAYSRTSSHHRARYPIDATRRDATLIPREANICRAKAQPVLWYRLHVEAGHVRSVTRADWPRENNAFLDAKNFPI